MNIPSFVKDFGNYVLGKSPGVSKSADVSMYSDETFASNDTLTDLSSDSYRGGSQMPGDDFWFLNSINGGSDYHFNFAGHNSCIKAFRKCAPLNAIIHRKAQAYINGKRWILNKKGKEVENPVAAKLRQLFNKPNLIQSERQFMAQGYMYMQLFGFNVVLFIKPLGFKNNIDAYQMWNIPPSIIDWEETNYLFSQTSLSSIIQKVVIRYKGERKEIPIEDILILKDISLGFESLVLPESKVRAHQDQINNIIASYEARRVLIRKRGALGILSNDSASQMGPMPLLPKDKEELQREFRNYGIMPDQAQVIMTNASLKWQAMGYPTKELMLFEEITDDIMRLCDGWNYPYRLLASDRTNALGGSDMKDSKASLYQDATIPEAAMIDEQWSNHFKLEDERLHIETDYSHVAVLQEDKVSAANAERIKTQALGAQFQMGLVTINEMLEELGRDPLGEQGNVRITDLKNSDIPLSIIIGIQGIGNLVTLLNSSAMSPEAKQATLEVVYGIKPEDAKRMSVASENSATNSNNNSSNTSNNNDNATAEAA